jgi:hypothetical protein
MVDTKYGLWPTGFPVVEGRDDLLFGLITEIMQLINKLGVANSASALHAFFGKLKSEGKSGWPKSQDTTVFEHSSATLAD